MKQKPDNTDFSDARMLAELEPLGYLPRVWPAPDPIREFRLVVRCRQRLANQILATKLGFGAVVRE